MMETVLKSEQEIYHAFLIRVPGCVFQIIKNNLHAKHPWLMVLWPIVMRLMIYKEMGEWTPLRWVFDTNVVMDLFHFNNPPSRLLREGLETGRVSALVDVRTLAELERVLAYPEFGLDQAGQQRVLDQFMPCVEWVAGDGADLTIPLPRCRDKDDQKFLELAARSQAAVLVSRDREVLRLARSALLTYRIVLPKDAAALLEHVILQTGGNAGESGGEVESVVRPEQGEAGHGG